MAAPSTFELNDTLQITKEQGFPQELCIDNHLNTPYILDDDLINKTFHFTNKPGLRNFVAPPVRCFLVENKEGKWIYRGQCHILSIQIDYLQRQTSGTYRIIKLFTPVEMKTAFMLIDGNKEMNYFLS